MHRRSLLLAALLAPALATRARAASGAPRVVATVSVLGDMVNQIAGKDVALTTIVGPDGDTEAYEPSAADARALAEADLLVMNDLNPEFEPWLPSLMNQAQFQGTKLVATNGVHTLRKAEEENTPAGVEAGSGEIDQHAWHDAANAAIYVANIQKGLIELDPAHASDYRTRGNAYHAQVAALDGWAKKRLADVPAPRRKVITSHDGFAYLARAYKIDIIGARGWTNDKEASAQQVADLIQLIKANQVHAIFIENMNDPRVIQRISQETGVKIGGELFSDALSKPGEGGDTYVKMFQHNIETLRAGMLSGLRS
ncbi:MAG: zinc ABC transporter substrate-binding protein [Acetobacteraceae bacterium]|nr:zinc ABC transporter substrate-binding protein [Acetobacteraceae bacterium]